jgi:hypothetical protein
MRGEERRGKERQGDDDTLAFVSQSVMVEVRKE